MSLTSLYYSKLALHTRSLGAVKMIIYGQDVNKIHISYKAIRSLIQPVRLVNGTISY